ncbi:MAG: response regulator transcription factor [Chromatiales bacterium]|nr:response regulator transcription factor [Chromatiales bacterium]
MAGILIVDSEGRDASYLQDQLGAEGHDCYRVADGSAALELLAGRSFDLVLSEWRLPDMSGLEFAHALRRAPGVFPTRFILLSTRPDPQIVAAALDSGVDDFLPKGIRAPELQARIHAALRRPPAVGPGSVAVHGSLRLDRNSHQVSVDGHRLHLAPAEYRLLAFFIDNAGRALPRQQLLEQVWRKRQGIGERTVDVHVRRLRAALEPHGCSGLLQTVRGYGYRFGE